MTIVAHTYCCTCVLLYSGENIGGVKFWQIATDKSNGEKNFGKSDGRSSVVSLYQQWKIFYEFYTLAKISTFNIFLCVVFKEVC